MTEEKKKKGCGVSRRGPGRAEGGGIKSRIREKQDERKENDERQIKRWREREVEGLAADFFPSCACLRVALNASHLRDFHLSIYPFMSAACFQGDALRSPPARYQGEGEDIRRIFFDCRASSRMKTCLAMTKPPSTPSPRRDTGRFVTRLLLPCFSYLSVFHWFILLPYNLQPSSRQCWSI